MADHGTAIEWTQAPGYKGETWRAALGIKWGHLK